jgi:hypothetical protein
MISWTVCSYCATASSARQGLFTAPLPRLSCPDPALTDTLAPDSFSLHNGHHPGATPAVAPRLNAHLVESAAVALISLCVSLGADKTLMIVLEGMRNSRMAVAANEAWNQGCSPQDVCHWADVEAGQPRVASGVII